MFRIRLRTVQQSEVSSGGSDVFRIRLRTVQQSKVSSDG